TVAHLPEHPTVVEIGCGSGHFLQALAQRRPGRYFGFDPNSSVVHNSGFQFEARFFEPLTDIPQLQPDLIVMRHVLEHFSRPAAFLERLLLGAQQCSHSVLLLIEVPCVDRLLASIRLADFFYEHPQQFTTSSFTAILQRVGAVQCLERAYWDEVIWGLVQLRRVPVLQEHWRQTATWRDRCQEARAAVAQQLQALVAAGKKVAIWGGTGKAAAFMHHYGVDAERFPLVVDSDPAKVGTHVPGTGQLIQFRDVLKTQPVDVIIIPSQWRVRDIWLEMEREGIAAAVVLTECNGRLVDASALLAGVRAPN
ncbi:MAG: class I SAM-dependent methyltransferase, partial [Gloeomargarita sp. SKYG98]|nr:class I SAM-dependent methyltransferase [Gloeomargarita sp. SKYG98]